MSDHTIKIVNGHVQFVYSDDLADLLTTGDATVTRVSHVEPHPSGGWTADMRPVGGPVLGDGSLTGPDEQAVWATGFGVEDSDPLRALTPFKTRAEALAAERAWLTKEKGL